MKLETAPSAFEEAVPALQVIRPRLSEDDRRMMIKYRVVIAGHLKVWEANPIGMYFADLDMALHDFNACAACDGSTCRTVLNRQSSVWRDSSGEIKEKVCYEGSSRAYYAMTHRTEVDGLPYFAWYTCKSVAERKEEIQRILQFLRRPTKGQGGGADG